jgi:nucleoid-associated protein YgaU
VRRTPSPFEKFSIYVPDADANMRIHTLVAGETLTWLAVKYYGTVERWQLIADRNNIVDVRDLEPGAQLIIPAPAAADTELESL